MNVRLSIRWMCSMVVAALLIAGAILASGCSREMAREAVSGAEGAHVLHAVTDEEFNRLVFGSPVPVLVDFWAAWCPPCRKMEPVLAELAAEWADSLRVVKVNTSEAQALAARFNIQALPTLMLVRDGRVVAMQEGAMRKAMLQEWIQQQLGMTGSPGNSTNP